MQYPAKRDVLLHYHHFPHTPAPTSLEFCYILPSHKGLMAVPAYFRIHVVSIKRLDGCLTVSKHIDLPTHVALFSVFSITQAFNAYFSWEYCGVEPKAPLSRPTCTPQHQCCHWSWTHPYTIPAPMLPGLNPFCNSPCQRT
jgi:hypothetical protein